jgi:hypothetical protein
LRGEQAWERLKRRNVTPFVNVSTEEVNEVYDRVIAAKGTFEYRVGEIYLSATADDPDRGRRERAADRRSAPPGRQFRRLRAAVFGSFDRRGRRRSRVDSARAAAESAARNGSA